MSTNTFFLQDAKTLQAYKKNMVDILKWRGFTDAQIFYFKKAYDHFVINPEDYDGSTKSQDLYDIPSRNGFNGLELASMLHDWLYVFFRVDTSARYMRMADMIMKKVMRKFDKSGFEISRRLIALWFIRWKLTLWRRWIVRKPKMENFHKKEMILMKLSFKPA